MLDKIFIEVNRTCHKNCYYCYNTIKRGAPSSPEIKQIISSVQKLSGKRKSIGLIFSGGEPLLNINDIKDIAEKLRPFYPGLRITIITNVDKYTEDFISFINHYKPYLVISYNSKTNSFLNYLLKMIDREKIFVRFTITPENVESIYNKIKLVISKYILCGISPAYGIEWDEKSLKSLQDLYFKLSSRRHRNYITDFINIPGRGICKSLKNPNAIDINGKIHPCHRAIYLSKKDIQDGKFTSECKFCPAYKHCKPCIYKEIPGRGCKIRVAISPVYELLLKTRRREMKKKVKITHKGKTYLIPEKVLKHYIKSKNSLKKSRKNSRNFYELGESDCY